MSFSQHQIKTCWTDTLSAYLAQLRYEDIPPEVVQRVKQIILQVVGVSLAAAELPETRKALALAQTFNGGDCGSATAWGSSICLSDENAAFFNGMMADALDWEDCAWTGHPSCGIIPTAWSVAETLQCSGKELICAIVGAFELYQRIAMAVQPTAQEQKEKGWGLCSWQIFGPVCAAVKLMGHSQKQINQALSMATTCCVLPTSFHEFTKSDAYHFEHGFRNQTAIILAKCAKLGVDNLMDGLDDPAAFSMHFTAEETCSWYTRELGSKWYITEMLLKRWPANMWCQQELDLTERIFAAHQLKPQDVEKIIVSPATYKRMDRYPEGFSSITQAQFNIPYVLAAMTHLGTPGANWYTPEAMKNQEILAFAEKVVGEEGTLGSPAEGFARFKAGSYPEKTLTVVTKSGETYSQTIQFPKGHPKNMFTMEESRNRFVQQSSACLSLSQTEAFLKDIEQLENVEDVSTISKLLSC